MGEGDIWREKITIFLFIDKFICLLFDSQIGQVHNVSSHTFVHVYGQQYMQVSICLVVKYPNKVKCFEVEFP